MYAGGTGAGKSPKGTVKQTHNVYTCQIQCDPGTCPTGTARTESANAPLVPRGTRARAAPVLPKHAHPANTARAVRIPPSRVRRATTAPPPHNKFYAAPGTSVLAMERQARAPRRVLSNRPVCVHIVRNQRVSELLPGSTKCINTNPLPTPSPNAVYPVTEEYCSLLCAQTPNCVVGVVTARNTCQLWGGDRTLTEQSDLIEPTSACLVLRQPLDAMTTIQISSETPGTAAPLTTTASLSAACRAQLGPTWTLCTSDQLLSRKHTQETPAWSAYKGSPRGTGHSPKIGDGVCGGQQR